MKFKDMVVSTARKIGVAANNKSPELLAIGGAVTSVAAFALAIKATNDVKAPLNTAIGEVKAVKAYKEDKYYEDHEDENYAKDLTKAYCGVGKVVARHYAIPVALEAAAIGMMFCSDKKWKKRNAGLAASLAGVQEMYDKYRRNVIETYGEDVDRDLRLGLKHETRIVEEEDPETGKTMKRVEDEILLNTEEGMPSYWARVFDESSCHWQKSHMCNRDTLTIGQSYLTSKLKVDGYLFVNDVYEYFDLPKCELGQYYGWIYDPDQPIGNANCIDLHLVDVTDQAKNNFLNGYERNCLIDLQPDGYIADKIWPRIIRGGDFKHLGRC